MLVLVLVLVQVQVQVQVQVLLAPAAGSVLHVPVVDQLQGRIVRNWIYR